MSFLATYTVGNSTSPRYLWRKTNVTTGRHVSHNEKISHLQNKKLLEARVI